MHFKCHCCHSSLALSTHSKYDFNKTCNELYSHGSNHFLTTGIAVVNFSFWNENQFPPCESSLHLIFSPCRVHVFQMRESITTASSQRRHTVFQSKVVKSCVLKTFHQGTKVTTEIHVVMMSRVSSWCLNHVSFHRLSCTVCTVIKSSIHIALIS